MTTIHEVIAAFAEVEDGLGVTIPKQITLKRIYKYLPASSKALETPCIAHRFRLVSEERANDSRNRRYDLLVELYMAKLPAETDVWSEVAAAFDEVLVTALDYRVKLGMPDVYQRFGETGSQDYQPTVLSWNGIDYIGMTFNYDLMIRDVVTFAP